MAAQDEIALPKRRRGIRRHFLKPIEIGLEKLRLGNDDAAKNHNDDQNFPHCWTFLFWFSSADYPSRDVFYYVTVLPGYGVITPSTLVTTEETRSSDWELFPPLCSLCLL